jgi:hypothetical protein
MKIIYPRECSKWKNTKKYLEGAKKNKKHIEQIEYKEKNKQKSIREKHRNEIIE